MDVVVSNKGSDRIAKVHEGHSRSLLKAISWRITGTLDTFVISFFVTGKPAIAGSIAATELLTKVALFYGHERLWAKINWGRRANQV